MYQGPAGAGLPDDIVARRAGPPGPRRHTGAAGVPGDAEAADAQPRRPMRPNCRRRTHFDPWSKACEINVPHGATPAHWRLLTTHTVTTLTDARRITGFYRERWTIEQLFRTKKTKGFDIEASRVADQGPFENLATATLIAAIQVLQLVRDRDGAAHRPMQDVFDPADQPAMEVVCASLEGNTPRQKNSHAKGSLAYASWVCARLGRLDRILRTARAGGDASGPDALQGHAPRLETREVDLISHHAIPNLLILSTGLRCVNPAGHGRATPLLWLTLWKDELTEAAQRLRGCLPGSAEGTRASRLCRHDPRRPRLRRPQAMQVS